jgi:hypothetical protein
MRRIAGGAIVVITLLAAFGCGSSGNDASIGTGTKGHRAALVPADATASANGMRAVAYRGVAFEVPADWPVYDLASDPTTCVRFDVHAVYLGTPGADMACPATVVGRADALLVEPTKGRRDPGSVAAATDTGLDVEVAGNGPAAHQVEATIPSAGVDVTLTYQDSDGAAQQILRSFRAVSR